MSNWTRSAWPLLAAWLVFLVASGTLLGQSLQINNGVFVYPLDDAYIHLAIAKNAVLHHVWGVTEYEFTNCTSAPLWTALLALTLKICGLQELAPLVWNVVFALLLIGVCEACLRSFHVGPWLRAMALILVVLLAPLPVLALAGMEHVLHTLLTIAFAWSAAKALAITATWSRALGIALALAPLLTTSRYEGLFLVFIACLLLLLKERYGPAFLLGALAWAPLIAYGLWSQSHGWALLPNSVILKGLVPPVSVEGMMFMLRVKFVRNMLSCLHLFVLTLGSLVFLLRQEVRLAPEDEACRAWQRLFLVTMVLQLQFAFHVEWYRYDAYLVVFGLLAAAISCPGLQPGFAAWIKQTSRWPVAAVAGSLVFLSLMPLAVRSDREFRKSPRASFDIASQQIVMADFLQTYYNKRTVLINDIGAVCWRTDIQLVDLWGLGTLEPMEMRIQRNFKTQTMDELVKKRGAEIAILYPEWYDTTDIGGLPKTWTAVGRWTVPGSVILGSDSVTFFALDPSARDELIRNLRAYSTQLPAHVQQSGLYRESP